MRAICCEWPIFVTMTVLATFARLYVDDLDQAIEALAASGVTNVRLRFGHATGLQLALVGDVLVLAGSPETLAPFRATVLTLVVDDLEQAIASAHRARAWVAREPTEQATGRNVTMGFPAGPVIEYVEWSEDTKNAAGI